MTVFFVFSDDSGTYHEEKGEKSIAKSPFYCRSCLIIPANEWFTLIDIMGIAKDKWGLPLDFEMKYRFLADWKRATTENAAAYPGIKNVSEADASKFIGDVLGLLNIRTHAKFVFTVTDRKAVGRVAKRNIIKMHFETMVQRVEMEIKNRNLAIFFIDNESCNKEDKMAREAFYQATKSRLMKIEHIIPSAAISCSNHNVGIQFADICAGAFNGLIRGWDRSIDRFLSIYPLVRKNPASSSPMGYGICEIPTDEGVRKKLEDLIRKRIRSRSPSVLDFF